MAFIDYGAIAFKNGECISTEMFTPMKDTCGFSDEGGENSFDGDQFVICGDKDLCVGFYKTFIIWKANYDDKSEDNMFNPYQNFYGWKYWKNSLWYISNINEVKENQEERYVDLIVKHKNGYYVAKWIYKGDKYKVYFGYGVDLGFYKKTKKVNYYRSPECYFKEFKRKIKNILNKIKRGY